MGWNDCLKKVSILLVIWVSCCGCALHALSKESYEQLVAEQLAGDNSERAVEAQKKQP